MSSDIKYLTKELNDRIQDTKNMAQALRRVDELISDNRRLEVTIHILEHKIEAMGKHIKLQDKKGTIIMQRRSGLPNEPMLGAYASMGELGHPRLTLRKENNSFQLGQSYSAKKQNNSIFDSISSQRLKTSSQGPLPKPKNPKILKISKKGKKNEENKIQSALKISRPQRSQEHRVTFTNFSHFDPRTLYK
jgi:hypothetical protein